MKLDHLYVKSHDTIWGCSFKAGYFYGGVWIHTQIEVGERLVEPSEATGHSIALPDLRELEKNPSCCNITPTVPPNYILYNM
jgi:hypothetical protein